MSVSRGIAGAPSEKKRALIIGASGFVGKSILNTGKGRKEMAFLGTGFRNVGKDLSSLDMRDKRSVGKIIERIRPDAVIYASGIADADRVEADKILADILNANALECIADSFQGYFVYLSTISVFDGTNPPYAEDAERKPINYYGQSKVKGEELTRKLFPRHSIVRLDTMYGYNDAQDRKTFVTGAIHALSLDKSLYLDNEIKRAPVLIDEASEYICDLVQEEREGIFQLSAEESVTKYEWGRLVAKVFGYDESLVRSVQEHPEYARPAVKRALDPRMVSSCKLSGVEEGLKKMRAGMVDETKRRFEDDMEYFDVDGRYLGRKSRSAIHRNGDWHMAVQVFIARKGGKEQLQVLSQHRRVVDIAKRKWDHTAAVQMLPEDGRDPLKGIARGLKLELGIDAEDIKQIHLVSDGIAMRSSRKYGDEPEDLYNREFVFVAVAELKDGVEIRPDPIKIDRIRWIDWDALIPAVLVDAAGYTKNLRHNFVNTALADHIKRFSCAMLGLADGSPAPEDRLAGSAYYSPPDNRDLALSVFAGGKACIEHLSAEGRIERAFIEGDDAVIEGLLKQPNLLPRYVYDNGIFAIDPAMIPDGLPLEMAAAE